MFALISWIVGLIVGALARLVLTGSDPMGWLATIAIGVAGSLVGGFVGSLFWTKRFSTGRIFSLSTGCNLAPPYLA
jgi:uncharacterized membrane protein YeaQ/YmgE (transglycosylase-associated protein family)